jgi:tetratricopeptide (TPR) repeat protein
MASKGFGGSKAEPSKNAMQFILAFKKYMLANPDLKDVQEFFSSHLSEIDELLLSSLPLIFRELIKNKKPQEPYQIAAIFCNFSNSIREFPSGDRSLNLEMSISSSQLALKIFTLRDYSEEWSGTQNNLGNAYLNRIRGERADNIEQAIASYELALQVRTRDAFPEYWADTQNNLGAAYNNRIRGERADNIEQAIASYELALQVYTRDAFPERWASTQNNFGAAYWVSIRGERTNNLEQAISYLESALQVYTRDTFPEKWARTQQSLGTGYRDRVQGSYTENIEKAIDLYNQAAQIFTRESFPEEWATNQAHLAEALMKRAALTSSCTDLDTAINLLQTAIKVAVVGSPDYIDTQYRLGNALSRRYEHTKNPAELEQAVQAYKIALDAISPEHYDRKQIWQALPTTQAILGSRLVKDGEWQEGLQLLLNSLTQLSTGDDQLAHANALYQTARAYEVMSDLGKARLYYRDALRLYDHLNDALGRTQSRAGLGSVLVSQGHLEKGINELEQARQEYLLLQKVEQVHEVDKIYQAAQRALERQATEVYV